MTMLSPVEMLPDAMSFDYLRRLVNISPRWTIAVQWDTTLPAHTCAGLTASAQQGCATISLSPLYHFSVQALGRAITHELIELAMHGIWAVFADTVQAIADPTHRGELETRMRRERDRQVDARLDSMPFWSQYDIPVPKACVDTYELHTDVY
jgi:hypothetical protein